MRDGSRKCREITSALLLAVGVTMAAAAAPARAAEADAAGEDWRRSEVWDDGNAEFCAYEIDWRRYGRGNPGRALLISVKEPWAPDLDVKADLPRADGFDVLKLNHVRDVPTGIYTYHQMASVFLRRDSGDLQKIAATSSEGCGVTTALMVDGELETHSYFDGQGDQSMPYPDGALPEDGLALALRDYLHGPLPRSLDVLPTLMTGRFPELRPAAYGVDRRRSERSVPAGTFETIELELAGERGWMRFSFAAAAPHPLVRYEAHDGTIYRLAKCERIPYWQMNGLGGENWLPKGVR